jgi:single-stranded-DNA-specific exonuclease
VVEPRHRWRFPPDAADPDPDFADAIRRHELSTIVAGLLAARGVTTAKALDAFFGSAHDGLNDPRLLPDADRVVWRIGQARASGERVMVFGDFDADGLTGLAILVTALRRLGLEALPYVPDRLEEGHGLSRAAIAQAATSGVSLIVTVDCGSTSHVEIDAARTERIDVIVTDHHRVPPTLPAAVAVVNPQRADSEYPDPGLAGSGVAFTVARLLLDGTGEGRAAVLALADLATIGTVADVAPILGENRAIARIGLEVLRSSPRPGIAALLERAGVAAPSVDLETVAFSVAPRLNAAGRMGEAAAAARLLLAETPEEAGELATELEAANTSRRDLTRTTLVEAREAAGLGAKAGVAADAVVVAGPWPVGVIGLVASRLVEETGRPAIVASVLGETIRGSCRGDGSLDLATALDACRDLFDRFGGHAGAAGFELRADRWDAFRDRFQAIARSTLPDDPRLPLTIDLAIPAAACDYALHRDLLRLAPTGPGNPDPVIAVLGLTVIRVREASGGHTQLVLRRDVDVLDGIAFDRADLASSIANGDRVDVAGRLVSRQFGGFESLQIEIRDVATAGWHELNPSVRQAVPEAATDLAVGAATPA